MNSRRISLFFWGLQVPGFDMRLERSGLLFVIGLFFVTFRFWLAQGLSNQLIDFGIMKRCLFVLFVLRRTLDDARFGVVSWGYNHLIRNAYLISINTWSPREKLFKYSFLSSLLLYFLQGMPIEFWSGFHFKIYVKLFYSLLVILFNFKMHNNPTLMYQYLN